MSWQRKSAALGDYSDPDASWGTAQAASEARQNAFEGAEVAFEDGGDQSKEALMGDLGNDDMHHSKYYYVAHG